MSIDLFDLISRGSTLGDQWSAQLASLSNNDISPLSPDSHLASGCIEDADHSISGQQEIKPMSR